MSHILVGLFFLRTEYQKKQLTSEIVKVIKTSINILNSSISVSLRSTRKSVVKKLTNLI